MVEIAGLTATGRQLKDPAATLVELENDDGLRHTSIVFDDALTGHEALTLNVELVQSFMEYPMVKGLVEMSHCDLTKSAFTYPTGNVWTLTEVMRIYRDVGQVAGVRAALELCYLCAEIIKEAGETGPMQGCFSHGNLTPSRIAIRADGHVQIFGYGLAQVEVIKHLDDGYVVSSESLRYAPPERLEGQPEDPSADTYALTVIAWEMMTGKPLYNTHNVDKLKRMISMSEGSTMLAKSKEKGIPKQVLQTFARALIYDPDTRLSGEEFMDEIETLLGMKSVKGSSLVDIMKRARGTGTKKTAKGRKLESKASTGMFSKADLAEMSSDEEEEPEEEKRWSKTSRSKAAPVEEAPAPDEEDKPSRRRRRRAEPAEAEAEEAAPRRRRRRTADTEEAPVEEAKPRRRRRRSEEPEKEATKAEEAPAEEEPKPRRRRRSEAPKEEAKAEEAPAEEEAKPRRKRSAAAKEEVKAEEAPSEEEAKPRRRRRRSDEPAAEDTAVPAEDKPKRQRRRATAKKEGDAKKEAAAEEEPAPRRRRRGAAKEAEKEPAEEEEKPKRRRRRRSE